MHPLAPHSKLSLFQFKAVPFPVNLCLYILHPVIALYQVYIQSIHTGRDFVVVFCGGSGKFDNLRPDHDCIIIDDDVCPNMLNMCEIKSLSNSLDKAGFIQ